MSKKSLVMAAVTAAIIIGSSIMVSAAAVTFKSNGKIVYQNPAGDVIFDAEDFDRLYDVCK